MAKAATILIENAVVVTVDPRRRVIEGGWVLVEDGRVAEVRAGSPSGAAQRAELKIDA